MALDNEQDDKNLGGRPLKFKTVEELNQKIEAYFGNCDSHLSTRKIIETRADGSTFVSEIQYFTEREPYTVNGLAYTLNTTRDVLIDYESGKYDDRAPDADEASDILFSNAIKSAKRRIAADVERRMLKGESPASAGIFWLKNNDNWRDRQELDHTSDGRRIEAPPVYVSSIAARGNNDAEAETETD
ncbi:terminase small subunit [Antrihabitans sp. YC2-6]|uniref:terminase small subunit n=1 Tax=Antrihabitans sp. YC2-6 TaxID=2799498 RepID=UPI0018F34E91|nr:terminase small subunit [Antrihabitans sp. YC2-6]MBJ8343953.1 hypothetical protein [Antrihabitans sp. YC2-6]